MLINLIIKIISSAVSRYLESIKTERKEENNNNNNLLDDMKKMVAAEFQRAAIQQLESKIELVLTKDNVIAPDQRQQLSSLVVSGGVASNLVLRKRYLNKNNRFIYSFLS